MNVYVAGLLWMIGAVVAGAAIAYSVRRYGSAEGRPDNNDAAGQAFTIVAGLHAVVVAFVLISLFDAASKAGELSATEARSLVTATWAAESLPDPAPAQARDLARAYASTVVTREWPRMSEGADVPGDGWSQLDTLRATIEGAPVPGGDEWLTGRKTKALDDLLALYQARQARLDAVTDNQLGVVVWFVLAVGSLLFVLLPNLFGGTKLVTHVIIVSTLAVTTTLLCFAIYQLQNPFAGGAKVGPDAFGQAIARLG
ncbi:MAG TPA: hypothetical protein VJT49_05415 [Amycolatopsis sp.]|uniref:bestrophin-like domain n=1 Tax=Amycolatopsis sp. TaxID=37632 RepID=UPI002B4A0F99|nr:hypothetical protein [Amycolatopsis sp.]HKS44545.1 hypothetical protein [Amycolatopsis sp.]